MASFWQCLGVSGSLSLISIVHSCCCRVSQNIFEDLEKVSMMVAAAVHDLDHMGRTSSFLVNAEHPLALLYNDMSVQHASFLRS